MFNNFPKNPRQGDVFSFIRHDCKYSYQFNGSKWAELGKPRRELSANWYGDPCCDSQNRLEKYTSVGVGDTESIIDVTGLDKSVELKIDVDTVNDLGEPVGQSFLVFLRLNTLDFTRNAILGDRLNFELGTSAVAGTYMWLTNNTGHPMNVVCKVIMVG